MSTAIYHHPYPGRTVSCMAGACLLMTLVLSFTISAVAMLVGGRVGGWIFPLSLLLSAGAYIFTVDARHKTRIRAIAVVAGCVVLPIAMCALFEDPSFDGNTYHQETIARLLGGWNPYRDGDVPSDMSPWTRHYAKGLEIIASSIASATGSMESGKAVNFLLLSATALMLPASLRQLHHGISRRDSIILTVALVANPVAMSQMLTFYIDYSKYYYLLLTVILACRITTAGQPPADRARDSLLLTGVIWLAIATKFNIFFEEGLCVAAIIVWLWVRGNTRGAWQVCACGAAALLAGAFVLCFHPYVTNYITSGHPLYPLMGDGAADIMTGNTPALFSHGRVVNFLISYFTPVLATYDARVNGFGFLTTILLLLSAVVFIRSRRSVPAWMWYALAVTLASCFMFDQSWWARYVCQLWFVPCMAFMVTFIYARGGNAWLRGAFATLILLSTLLSFASTLCISGRLTMVRQYLYSKGRRHPIVVSYTTPQLERHFSEHGITVVELGSAARCGGEKSGRISYYGEIDGPGGFPTVIATHAEIEALTAMGRNFGLDLRSRCDKGKNDASIQ